MTCDNNCNGCDGCVYDDYCNEQGCPYGIPQSCKEKDNSEVS